MQDPIENRITHINVAACHIDLGPQDALAFRILAGAHPAEEIEIFRNWTLSVGAVFPWLG